MVVMDTSAKIYVAGHRGLVGSAIVRRLQSGGYNNVITRTHSELDLMRQADVEQFFAQEKPDYVFMAAAKVGGIQANNTYRADFIYDNLQIQNNVIYNAYASGVKKLLFLGSSCIYPKLAPQPLKEEYLLTGPLEETNEPYAIAKIAGIKLCESLNRQYGTSYISVMPTNLYGQGDNFDLETSHAMPALVRKMIEAKESQAQSVVVWGSGKPLREWLYVDDLADAIVFLMNEYEGTEIFNIGTGKDISIADLASLIKKVVGYEGEIVYDSSKPDGTPQKLLDVSKINNLGWTAQISLEAGIQKTVEWFEANRASL